MYVCVAYAMISMVRVLERPTTTSTHTNVLLSSCK